MAQFINEAKRMQKLAGLVKEVTPPSAPLTQTGTVNTSDETRLQDIIKNSPILQDRLKNINSTTELDGFFKSLLSYTSLEDTSKSLIVNALTKALKELEPTSSNITTKKVK